MFFGLKATSLTRSSLPLRSSLVVANVIEEIESLLDALGVDADDLAVGAGRGRRFECCFGLCTGTHAEASRPASYYVSEQIEVRKANVWMLAQGRPCNDDDDKKSRPV